MTRNPHLRTPALRLLGRKYVLAGLMFIAAAVLLVIVALPAIRGKRAEAFQES